MRVPQFSAAFGGLVWIAFLALRWAEIDPAIALLLLAPLVIVPLALTRREDSTFCSRVRKLYTLAAYTQFPAAVLLPIAFAFPAGPWAAALTGPWLLFTAVLALAGVCGFLDRESRGGEDYCQLAALVYLPIGAAWLLLARTGIQPLEFEPQIVLLTAVHFHFAGFALPLAASWSAAALGAPTWARAVCWLVIASVPLTAVGITATQLGGPLFVETAAAWSMGIAGLATAWLQSRVASAKAHPAPLRALWLLSSLALAFGMILALLYGSRHYLPIAALDIPRMQAIHGAANALGFALCSLLAWSAARKPT